MPSTFDDLMDELKGRGLEDEFVDRIREATAASPLRKQADQASERASHIEEENVKLRSKLTLSAFEKAGIKVKPDTVKLPDDLDITDDEAVTKWAGEVGLVELAPPVDEEDLDTQERISSVTNTSEAPPGAGVVTPAMVTEWPADRWARFAKEHPHEAEQLRQGEEVRGLQV